MKTKKYLMLMAAMLLSCTSAFAQNGNNTPAKGDVNEDGTVDVADIVAVIDIMKNGGGTATVGYFYLGTTKPTALNYKTLPGAVTSYASFDDAVGATVSVAAGQTLYLLCPAAWVEEKTPTLEDKDGNSISFLEEKDEVTISDYVIYKTQVWNAPNDVVLKTPTPETPTYYWYVGQTNPQSIGSTVSSSTEIGWHEIGQSLSGFNLTFNNQNMIEFDNKTQYYLVIPNDLHVYAADGSTNVEDTYFTSVTSNISNHKAYQYTTSVYEVKGLVIK